jgi:inner membrane protein
MNVVEHFFIGWCVANLRPDVSERDRTLITLASVIPDVDGLGLLVELPTRNTSHPLLWWTEYHHVLAHNVGFAFFVALIVYRLATKPLQTMLLAFLSFHLHILGDIVGARGPDGYQWPIAYFLPFSRTPELSWNGQWALNSWQNFAVTGAALGTTFVLAWRRGFSPVGMFSKRADLQFVEAVRARFGMP